MLDPTVLTRYRLTIERAAALPAFRLIDIEHLSGAENRGSQNIFVWILDAAGQRLRWPELRLRACVAGYPDHDSPLDKRDNPPGVGVERGHGDAPMGCDAQYSVRIVDLAGRVGASDVAHGLSAKHPDEGEGNTMCHHSFRLTYAYTPGGVVITPPDGPGDGGGDGEASAALRAWMAEGELLHAELAAWWERGRGLVG